MVFSGFGPRPDEMGGYGVDNFAMMVAFAVDILPQYRVTKIISGMSLGWEQALALAATELGIPFHAALPFEGQENVWPERSQYFYRSLLGKAEHAGHVNRGGFDAKKFHARDQWVVDKCDGILVLWQEFEAWKMDEPLPENDHPDFDLELDESGNSSIILKKRRNTNSILKRVLDYANEEGTKIVNVWPQWLEFEQECGYEGFRDSLMEMCIDEL